MRKLSMSKFLSRYSRRFLVATIVTFVLCGLCFVGFGAHAQRTRRNQRPAKPPTSAATTQTNANTPAQAQTPQKKRITPLRSTETAEGSSVTITSDAALNDYSAYRSGNKFYVVIPQADSASALGAVRGKGFNDAQVQRRGNDVVLSFSLQPGASASVNQRFNRLIVNFNAPGAASQANNQNNANRPPTNVNTNRPNENTRPNQTNTQTPVANTNQAASTPNANQPAVTPEQFPRELFPNANTAQNSNAANQQTPAFDPGVLGVPTPTVAPTPSNEIAQAMPTPASNAPSSAIPNSSADRQDGSATGFGAMLVRNWWMVLIAAVLLGVLALVAFTRSGSRRDEVVTTRTAAQTTDKKKLTDKATLQSVGVKPALEPETTATNATAQAVKATTPLVAASSLTSAAAPATKAGRKKSDAKKHDQKIVDTKASDTDTVLNATAPAIIAPATPLATTTTSHAPDMAATQPLTESDLPLGINERATTTLHSSGAETTRLDASDLATTGAVTAALAGATLAAGIRARESKEDPIAATQSDVKAADAVETINTDRAQSEVQLLLDGDKYDEHVIGTREAGARQIIAAELLAALAGRNAERKERARQAYFTHDYFADMVRDLRDASAPAERASAARALGMLGDFRATPELSQALKDKSPDVRRAAVEALTDVRDPSSLRALRNLRDRERDRKVPQKLIRRAIETVQTAEMTAVAEPTVAVSSPTIVSPVPTAPVAASQTLVTSREDDEVVTADHESAVVPTPAVLAQETSPTIGAVDDVLPVDRVETSEQTVAQAQTPEQTVVIGDVEYPAIKVDEQPTTMAEPTEASEADEKAIALVTDATSTETIFSDSFAMSPTVRTQNQSATKELEVATSSPDISAIQTLADESLENDKGIALAETTLSATDTASEPPSHEAGDWIDVNVFEPNAGMNISEVATGAPRERADSFERFAGETATHMRSEIMLAPVVPLEEVETVFETRDETVVVEPPTELPEASGIAQVKGIALDEASDNASPLFVSDSDYVSELTDEPLSSGRDVTLPVSAEQTSPSAFIPPGAFTSSDSINVESETLTAVAPTTMPEETVTSDDVAARITELENLARGRGANALPEINKAFDDDAPEVRAAAARALNATNADRTASFTQALREASPERRRRIGAAIATSGLADESISQLTGESRDKTYDAFSLLFLMAKAGEVQPLLRAIESHTNTEVRLAVIKLLALSGQQDILPAFRRLAVRGSLPAEVRSSIMEAIYQISNQATTV